MTTKSKKTKTAKKAKTTNKARKSDKQTLGFQAESAKDLRHCLEIDPAYSNCKRHLALTSMIADDNELAMSLVLQVAQYGFSVFNFHAQFTQRYVSLGNRLVAILLLNDSIGTDSNFPVNAVVDAMEFPERDHSRGLEELLDWIDKTGSTPASFSLLLVPFKAYHLVEPIPFQNRWVWLRENTGFRTSEYFAPMISKTGAPEYWREKGFPPNCRPLGEEDFECD